MSGCLLAEYELSQIQELSGIPQDGALIKTIVTTNMADAIAEYYGVKLIEVLTGFKYIGQQILGFEQKNEGFMDASQIQYVARTGNFVKNGFEYSGVLRLLKIILCYDYLWINVRVKGGANGCMTAFLRCGE